MKIIPLHPFEKGKFTIVDDDIYHLLKQIYWNAQFRRDGHTYAAVCYNDTKKYWLARIIINAPPDLQVDHINRNSLDNRRINLRLVTNQQNQFNRKLDKTNTSGFKGVAFQKHSPTKPWRAFININKKKVHVGYYRTAYEAAEAYDEAAKIHYGVFAATNKDLGLLKNNSIQKVVRGPS